MNIPPTTDRQKQIIIYLYKFRYLTINHFQKLLSHKDPHRIKEWLKDLKEKKYIASIKDKNITHPTIYCLDTKARYILKDSKDSDQTFLNRLYKEKNKEKSFIDHHVFITTVYLFFFSKKEYESELKFFTKQDLKAYQYFPDPLPDSYIAVKAKEKTIRYFLDLFDLNVPPFVLRNRIKYYLKYFQDGNWQGNTENSPLPLVLFICPNERLKKHIYMYSKSLLQKYFNNEIKLFLTTKDAIESYKQGETWEQVTI